MTAPVPANEVQNDVYKEGVYKALSAAAEATDGDARSKSFAEADQLLRKHNATGDDTKAISARLACEGKLGKLIIGEFGVGALGYDKKVSQKQLQSETGEGATTPSKDLIASAVLKEFDQIDGTIGDKKDGQLTAIEIESWVNYSGASKFCTSEAQTATEAPAAGAPETPTVFNEPSPPPESAPTPAVDPTKDPFSNEFSTVPQDGKPRGFDARFNELRDPAEPAPPSQVTPETPTTPPVGEKPEGFDARFKELRDPADPPPPSQVTPETPTTPPVDEKPQGFDARFKELRDPAAPAPPSQVTPETPTTPPVDEKPQGFDARFNELRDPADPAPPIQVTPENPNTPPVGEKPQGFDARFNELREPADPAPPIQVTPENPNSPPIGEKPQGFEKNFERLKQQENPEPEKASAGEIKEQWGTRTFDLQADGTASYKVKTGDTVWSIAADVAEKRLSRKPSNNEIGDLTKAISEASGLNKNGRNPDLIYADKDVLTIPPAKTEATPNDNNRTKSDEPKTPTSETGESAENQPPRTREKQEHHSKAPETGGIDKGQAVDAMRGLTTDNLALMKKALEIQAQSDPKFQNTNLSLIALSAMKANDGELENKISKTYPDALQNGFTAEQLSTFATDPKSEINDQQRQSIKYIADNFSTFSPEDQYMTHEDMQKFAAQALGLQSDSLNKMVADEKNPLTSEERKTLSYFSSNFKTVSPDDDILTMPDLKAFVEKFELAKAAQAQSRASVKK
jgi:hypothetical protein